MTKDLIIGVRACLITLLLRSAFLQGVNVELGEFHAPILDPPKGHLR